MAFCKASAAASSVSAVSATAFTLSSRLSDPSFSRFSFVSPLSFSKDFFSDQLVAGFLLEDFAFAFCKAVNFKECFFAFTG